MDIDEETLIARAVAGDHATFQSLVERHMDRLYGLLLGMVGDPHDAEDLLQETIARSYRHLGTFRREASFGTWCTRIAINLARDHFRRRARMPVMQSLRGVETIWRDDRYTVDPEKVALRADDRSSLSAALAYLPPAYRATLLLHDMEGYTMQEVAKMTGVKLPTAKARLRRARMAMVSYLDSSRSGPETAPGETA